MSISPKRLLLFVVVGLAFSVGLPFSVGRSQAQPLECAGGDRQCLEDAFVEACEQRQALEGSCFAWLRRVEQHPLAENPEWRLIAASGYRRLAGFAGSREQAQRFREQSGAIYRELLARWTEGYYAGQAYVGLAGLAQNLDESIALARNALQADPSNAATRFGLAQNLRSRGRVEDYGEAAGFYRDAYAANLASWYSAANALQLYDLAGRSDLAAAFRDEVIRDTGMDDFANEVVSPRFVQDLERAEHVLETACSTYIMEIFGPDTCIKGIDTLVAATREGVPLSVRQSVAGVAATAMGRLAASGVGSQEEEDKRAANRAAVLREWIDAGAVTAEVWILWAQHPASDLDESVFAFEGAVEHAPDNGKYRYWLALGYMQQRRIDEAIESLTIARDTLPENSGISRASVDAQIRRAEAARGSSP